ncbi:MAG: type II toxin-antitoxin system VapC family toxin [bacterium]|nr:MAG: type II toxin-antitoxin system VapC family toxin [bacterium]
MILLDTNIVSTIMRPAPPEAVIDWLNRQETVTLYLSTITLAEIGYGLWILPEGKCRRSLEDRFEKFVAEGFEQRILDFDRRAAHLYGEVMGRRKAMGRPLAVLDGQIASISRANDLAIATRNVRDFEGCEVEIINPFEQAE